MDKGIGFRRNIHLAWLDATAKFLLETDNSAELRDRLDRVVGEMISSRENRRMAIDILINIWVGNGERYPKLRAEALNLFANADTSSDRIWLHYGLTMLYYDFFRLGVDILGRISRYSDEVTARDLKKQIYAELGQLGAIDKAAERIIFSLRDWESSSIPNAVMFIPLGAKRCAPTVGRLSSGCWRLRSQPILLRKFHLPI